MARILVTNGWQYQPSWIEKFISNNQSVVVVENEKTKEQIQLDEVEILVCNNPFNAYNICDFPKLTNIITTSVGLDKFPLKEIYERNIKLYSPGSLYANSMAEWAITCLLVLEKNIIAFSENAKVSQWNKQFTVNSLFEKKALIIGLGNVGKQIARLLSIFQLESIDGVSNHCMTSEYFSNIFNYSIIDKKSINEYDYIFISCSLNSNTVGLINESFLNKMKDGSILINNSRGTVIDENDLVEFLKKRNDVRAAMDVFENEPLGINSDLWKLENLLITPHISFKSDSVNSQIGKYVDRKIEQIKEGMNESFINY